MEEDGWEPTVVAATVATDGGKTKLCRRYCEMHDKPFQSGSSKLTRVCPGKKPGK